ncbi:right-handed parallel beta-helix repeat-containing protein [Nocardioides baculatus]|uniref:Right-handed parallel beta-helix repeat-containing protein n=1 Tax=Nocardioides baculatus TaxID=2801337 RepID=A0ABS1L4F6_9ACTN|nr:right-handed parallel beta-helix repeat-containing protein [Nocardioides baculatus]MBL0746579.1 right-handed parallel beta-helix repeat-containing protein [Nocardioides baculatus]
MRRAGVLAAAVVAVAVASAAPSSGFVTGAARPPQPSVARTGGTVVGTGTPASCTSRAVVRAVARGGVITFDCGPQPVTIEMKRTAKVVNTSASVVLDGGGLVTLSGGGERRILYMNTCDRAQVWTTSHCNDQAEPRLVVRRIRLADGDATGETTDGGGGGAIFVRGGRLKIIDSQFVGNRCDRTGPDLGGGAVRVLDQYADRAVVVRRSTFTGGRCSNGAALSSIGVSWRISGSTFTDNRAIGRGANPQRTGTPGGGSGGAIYLDGDAIHLRVQDSTITGNHAREGGGAIFFVSNDRTGTLTIDGSQLADNPSEGFETLPGIFFLGASRTITDSTVR